MSIAIKNRVDYIIISRIMVSAGEKKQDIRLYMLKDYKYI